MRGTDEQQEWMFSYISAEKRVPKDHPLRTIGTLINVIVSQMQGSRCQLNTVYVTHDFSESMIQP